MSIRENLVIELMNLKDTVKYELSELNEQQYLFMNGPAPQLMKRAMKMSYILGQKEAIDYLLLLIDTSHENVLLDHCHDYQKQIQRKQFSLQEDIIHQINQSKDFESFLSTYYVNKGKYDIISKIQTFL
ncbi:hypothetical protein ACUW92_000699 [Staphylococcus epidermidis]|uniref:hypothetical protein n=1 Tax=Staphylococcus epidermidis TaxID=1282 RepID=UPI00073CBA80|nr:hypothetical protein [Staphylococcus epidermidis]ATQ58791.1 hypothetical protein CPZ21_01025 [Staphylococcus epidermidis]KSZ61722.1 hypothetical protein RES1_07400 [Staphylococcus epidermidis]KSZ64625.1 hypothetical protein RES3_06120 [Staphylococcus epidermidis]KSZ67651.1 hypothetical protein RES2_01755 [Staphylococcus epidermidis]KSZ68956.1 hypothetical protein RES4_04755 [Staphylococcus epidermidis]